MTDAEYITAGLTAINTIVIAIMWISDRRGKRFASLELIIKEGFEKSDKKMDKIQEDVTDIRERVSFLEAANIYTMPLEPVIPNPRSEAMKQHWQKRRQKKLAHKGTK